MLTLNCGIPGQIEQHIILQIIGGFKKALLLVSNNRRTHPSCTHKCMPRATWAILAQQLSSFLLPGQRSWAAALHQPVLLSSERWPCPIYQDALRHHHAFPEVFSEHCPGSWVRMQFVQTRMKMQPLLWRASALPRHMLPHVSFPMPQGMLGSS